MYSNKCLTELIDLGDKALRSEEEEAYYDFREKIIDRLGKDYVRTIQ